MSLLKKLSKSAYDKSYVNSPNTPYDLKLDYISPVLQNFCQSRITNKSDAIDVAQNTLFILLQKSNEYNPNKSFYSWAFKICHFQIKRYLTEKKRNKEDSFAPDSFAYQLNVIDANCPLNLKLKKELQKIQINLINEIKENKMGKKEREFFELSWQGLPREEIMKILNLKSGAYYQMKARIINKLRDNVQ